MITDQTLIDIYDIDKSNCYWNDILTNIYIKLLADIYKLDCYFFCKKISLSLLKGELKSSYYYGNSSSSSL